MDHRYYIGDGVDPGCVPEKKNHCQILRPMIFKKKMMLSDTYISLKS